MVKTSPLTRISRDPNNGAIRNYHDKEGFKVNEHLSAEEVSKQFLDDNKEEFKFDSTQIAFVETKDTVSHKSTNYQQIFKNIPVYDASVVVNVRKVNLGVVNVFNNFDYNVPENFNIKPSQTEKNILELLNHELGQVVKDTKVKKPKLFLYRYRKTSNRQQEARTAILKKINEKIFNVIKKLELETPKDETLFLVWQTMVSVGSNIRLEMLVDDKTSKIIAANNLVNYTDGKVFYPDPITSSGILDLETDTPGTVSPDATFIPHQVDGQLLRLDPPVAGNIHLTGTYCKIENFQVPNTQPPFIPSTSNFFYPPSDPNFLAVMAYYWIDTLQDYIKNKLQMSPAGDYQIPVDPQVNFADDQSYFVPNIPADGKGHIEFGLVGAPDASSGSVIFHEYGHAIHHHQSFPDERSLREGFGDLLACIFRDRFTDPTKFASTDLYNEHRVSALPWDDNPLASYGGAYPFRKLDGPGGYSYFDATNFESSYGDYLQGDIWASTVWKIYLNLGGNSSSQGKRMWAADLALKLHLEANPLYGAGVTILSKHQNMAQALVSASDDLDWTSEDIPGGLFHKVIIDGYHKSYLFGAAAVVPIVTPLDRFSPDKVDYYIDDGRNGEYDYRDNSWFTDDIRILRNSSDRPSTPGIVHQQPLQGQDNYLWVKVKRKGYYDSGSGTYLTDSGNVTVRTWRCLPAAAGLRWPIHWTEIDAISLPGSSPVRGGLSVEEWIGPFVFNPLESGHSCLMASVEADNDRANTQGLVGDVNNWQLVLYDNNIAQRNVTIAPASGIGGSSGIQSHEFRLINSKDHVMDVHLDIDHNLPKGWTIQFDPPDIKKISIPPNMEKWVTMKVNIPKGTEFKSKYQKAQITIQGKIKGIVDNGITFEFIHPSLYYADEKPKSGLLTCIIGFVALPFIVALFASGFNVKDIPSMFTTEAFPTAFTLISWGIAAKLIHKLLKKK